MRKLNLKAYTVKVKMPDNMNPGQEIETELHYPFMTSLLNLLFIREL